jgi:hypothetical protein
MEQVLLDLPVPGLVPDIVDGLIPYDDKQPSLDMLERLHPFPRAIEFKKGVSHDIFRIGGGIDDVLGEIQKGLAETVMHPLESILIPVPEGGEDKIFIFGDRSLYFYECMHE